MRATNRALDPTSHEKRKEGIRSMLSDKKELQLERERPVLEELIVFCARLLKIEKPIKLSIEPSHPSAMAAVRKLKDGFEVDDESEHYDEIEILLYENEELRGSFNEYQSFIILLSEIIHELVHVKHPGWDEDSAQEEDARITGIIMDYLKERRRHPFR
jgi:hypothetical protein